MPLADQGGIYATGHDFTERKLAEEGLRESEQRLRQIAESIREVIWLTDTANNEVLYVSPAYETIWGQSCDELYLNPKAWLQGIHPEDRSIALDGQQSAAAGNAVSHTYRVLRANQSIRTVRDYRFPIRNEIGDVYRIAGVAEDITEQLSLEEQLRQSQKMEAIGVLAGGVAHDFNNLLTVINGYAEFIIDKIPEGHPTRDFAKNILHAGGQAAALTQQLLAFSRKQILVPEVIDLNTVLVDMEKMLRRIIGEDIELRIVPQLPLWKTKVDRGQFEQVLMNLVVNARDAMPQGGKMTIETTNLALDPSYAALHSEVKSGDYVRLAVTDNGTGMDAATKARIFEPFFTTKGLHKGTGLGLSTVFGIVKQSGGHMNVYSELGVGTVFKLYFPANAEGIAASPAHAKSTRAPQGTETILLVEDEETVRNFARQVLRHYGYRVLESKDGREALETSKSTSDPIHLLVTDVVMPNLSGPKLAEQILAARPDIKALYMSGYTDDTIVHHLELGPTMAFLHKPFTPDSLARKVREVLDS